MLLHLLQFAQAFQGGIEGFAARLLLCGGNVVETVPGLVNADVGNPVMQSGRKWFAFRSVEGGMDCTVDIATLAATFTVLQREQLAVFVVVALAFAYLACVAVGVICFVRACGQFALYGKAAVLVVVEAAGRFALLVLLDGENATFGGVPDDFAVHHAGGEVARVGAFFQGEWRGLWAVAVLVVVLDDEAAIASFAKDFAGNAAGS